MRTDSGHQLPDIDVLQRESNACVGGCIHLEHFCLILSGPAYLSQAYKALMHLRAPELEHPGQDASEDAAGHD